MKLGQFFGMLCVASGARVTPGALVDQGETGGRMSVRSLDSYKDHPVLDDSYGGPIELTITQYMQTLALKQSHYAFGRNGHPFAKMRAKLNIATHGFDSDLLDWDDVNIGRVEAKKKRLLKMKGVWGGSWNPTYFRKATIFPPKATTVQKKKAYATFVHTNPISKRGQIEKSIIRIHKGYNHHTQKHMMYEIVCSFFHSTCDVKDAKRNKIGTVARTNQHLTFKLGTFPIVDHMKSYTLKLESGDGLLLAQAVAFLDNAQNHKRMGLLGIFKPLGNMNVQPGGKKSDFDQLPA